MVGAFSSHLQNMQETKGAQPGPEPIWTVGLQKVLMHRFVP